MKKSSTLLLFIIITSFFLFIGSGVSTNLECEKKEIYVKDMNNCTVTGCEHGWWFVTNLENNPLPDEIEEKTDDIGFSIEFGPVQEEGKILIKFKCLSPDFEETNETEIIMGPYIDCPESCQLKEDCTCTVNNCQEGLFLLENYENNPLRKNIIEEVHGLFNYTFKAYKEGRLKASMLCDDPFRDKSQLMETYLPEDVKFYMSSISCNETSCSLTIDKNVMEQGVNVIVQLIKEPYGIIYSTGSVDIEQGFTGEKEITLTNIKKCSEGTELKVLAIASVSGQRIDRLKDTHFCGTTEPVCGDGFCDRVAGENEQSCCSDCGFPVPGCESGNMSYWYTCDETTLTKHTYDCDDDDRCYAYENGCEDRDYYCILGGCNYTYSNRNTDTCSGTDFLDYHCSSEGCTHTSHDCSASGNWDMDSVECNCDCDGYDVKESTDNGNCRDGKDNDCDGFTDEDDCGCMPECDSSRECEDYTCDGTTYKCYYSNSGSYDWSASDLPNETACEDGHDNDCDGTCDAEGCDGMSGDLDCGVCETCNLRNGGNTYYCQHCNETEHWENINEGLICDYYTDESTPAGSIFCLNATLSSSQVCNLTCLSGSCEGKLPENCVCKKGLCGAECDSINDCTKTERCNGTIYQTRTASCTASCTCSYGPWINGTCTQSVQYCGAECDSNDDCPTGICNPDCTCNLCECTSGVCCDGCNFRPSSYVCAYPYQKDYGCPWGNDCGDDVGVRYKKRYCPGNAATCTGTISGWGNWSVADKCSYTETCAENDPTCNYDPSCVIEPSLPEITPPQPPPPETPPGGGGCPILKVFDGKNFIKVEKLNIHAPKEIDTRYASKFSMEPINGRYEIILEEAAYFFWDGSHIDSVELFDETGKRCELISAVHSKHGDVLQKIKKSDDVRVRTFPGEEVRLVFDGCSGKDFTFRIEGYNMKIPNIPLSLLNAIKEFFSSIFNRFT